MSFFMACFRDYGGVDALGFGFFVKAFGLQMTGLFSFSWLCFVVFCFLGFFFVFFFEPSWLVLPALALLLCC